jgi:hypothetical protein
MGQDLGALTKHVGQLIEGATELLAHGLDSRTAKPVERRTLLGGAQQPMLIVLAVDRHESCAQLGQGGRRHRPTTQVSPGASGGRHGAGEHDAAILIEFTARLRHHGGDRGVVDVEAGLDHG